MTIPIYNLTDTWNNGATVFTAIKMNVTNTSSASGSKLYDLLVGGTSMFSVKDTGEAVTTGLDIAATNPTKIGNASEFMAAKIYTTWTDLTGLSPNFANIEGIATYFQTWHADATYDPQTHAKTTQLPLNLYFDGRAAGQRFITAQQIYGYGMGDCFVTTCRGEYGGGPLPGDEGFGYSSVGDLSQPRRLTLGFITSVTRAAGNTTVTQAIIANKDPQTVTVASVIGISIGDWYQVQRRNANPEYNTEAVKILAVGVGTVTALFRVNQVIGATLTPALVLGYDNASVVGQLRVLVNLSGVTYSTGQVTSKAGRGLFGSGMTWANNMVGGDVINIGAISLDCDTYSGTPFDSTGANGPLRSWYEVKEVVSTTQVDIVSMSIANDQTYRSSRWSVPTNYIIRPAVRVLRNLANGLLVCETTSTVWAVNDVVEQAICPYPDCIGDNRTIAVYTAGATMRSVFSVGNTGAVPFELGLSIAGSGPKDTWSYNTGLLVDDTDTAISISNETSAAIRLFSPGPGKIEWFQVVNRPYIQYNASNSLDFVYGGNAAPLAGIFCTPVDGTTKLASAEFRTSWIGVSGNSTVTSHPFFRFATTPANFAAAATSVDVVLGDSAVLPSSGYSAFLVKTYGVEAFGVTEYGAGTDRFIQYLPETLTLVNGANGTPSINKSHQRITGPTGAFSIAGFTIAVVGTLDGAVIYLYNTTAQAMTILNDSGTVGPQSGILTLTGASVVFTGPSMATLIYNKTDNRWILATTYH